MLSISLPNSFCTTFIPKPEKDTIRKDHYKSVSLINIGAKILNKILVSQIQQYIKKDQSP
jgi:hypothetical protein